MKSYKINTRFLEYITQACEKLRRQKTEKMQSLSVQRADMIVRGNEVTKLMKQMMQPKKLILKVTETSKSS